MIHFAKHAYCGNGKVVNLQDGAQILLVKGFLFCHFTCIHLGIRPANVNMYHLVFHSLFLYEL